MKNYFFVLLFLIPVESIKAANYYINDATYNASDLYTTAVGNNSNNGTSASTPKATFANLWATYGPSGTNVITNGDVIYVDAGTYTSASAVAGTCNCGFNFTKTITIQGAGQTKTIFDNNYVGIAGSYYFANITAGVTIKDIQFTHYASNQNGQALQISATGSPGVTLTNVRTNANGGSSKYAAIYIGSSSNVTISGGGSFCNGDASHNAAGGIDIVGTSIVVNISNVSFADNYKSSAASIIHGAALSITGANSTTDVTLSHCLFHGNQTDYDGSSGAAIYATSGDLVLTDCVLENNDTYENSVKYGGAAYFTGGTQQFTRVLIKNNTNSGGSTYGTVSVNGGALTLTDSYFSGNTSDRGKDIYCKSGSITATNTTFGSSANQIATYGGTITITNCGTPTDQYSSGTFTNNGGSPSAFTNPTVPSYSGSCSGIIVGLPIDLTLFEAKRINNQVEIYWSTLTEMNNDYFLLEKSIDGINWFEINHVSGNGNSHTEIHYQMTDTGIMADVVYYKLTQVDFNGKKNSYAPISVRFPAHSESFFYVNMLGQTVDFEVAPSGIYLKYFDNGTSAKVVK